MKVSVFADTDTLYGLNCLDLAREQLRVQRGVDVPASDDAA